MARLLLVSVDQSLRGRWRAALADDQVHELDRVGPGAMARAAAGMDAALFDLHRPTAAPIDDWRRHCPALRVLAMVAAPDAVEGLHLLRQGVRGYCNRRMSPPLLRVAVDTVLSDEIWAGRLVLQRLLGAATLPATDAAPLALLTPRERDVAVGVAHGVSSKVLADRLGVSERTVKAHLTSIYRKTGCRNRVQLALAVNRDSPSLVGHG